MKGFNPPQMLTALYTQFPQDGATKTTLFTSKVPPEGLNMQSFSSSRALAT